MYTDWPGRAIGEFCVYGKIRTKRASFPYNKDLFAEYSILLHPALIRIETSKSR